MTEEELTKLNCFVLHAINAHYKWRLAFEVVEIHNERFKPSPSFRAALDVMRTVFIKLENIGSYSLETINTIAEDLILSDNEDAKAAARALLFAVNLWK